ncbi:MAG TPA: hypothetical protein PLX35_07745 [Cyclobacteriaceae bacterium]|nr:hypothetical protein [Cyclobacteriaceae bacterium]
MKSPTAFGVGIPMLVLACCLIRVDIQAQVPRQSLFYRYQAMQYQDLLQSARNRNIMRGTYVANPYVEFPLVCMTRKEVQEIWRDGETFFSRMKWKESQLAYEGAVHQDSSFCDAYFRIAQCQVHMNMLAEAWNTLKLTEKKFPANAMVYLGLGQMSIILDFPVDAIGYFNKMGELDPNNLEFYLGASYALFKANQYGEALHFLERGRNTIRAVRTSTPLLTVNGRVAGPIFENSNRNRWEYLTIYEAVLNYKLHRNTTALKLLRQVSNQNGDPDLEGTRQYFMALCYLNKGENYTLRAQAYLQKAASLGIQVDEALYDSAGLRYNPGVLSSYLIKSSIPYNRTDEPATKVYRVMEEIAEEEFENRNYLEALRKLEKITQEDHTSAKSFLMLAETQSRLNLGSACLATLESARKQFPDNEVVGLRLAREYVKNNNSDAALACYLNLIGRNPKSESAYLGAALVLSTKGEIRRGIDILIGYERGHRTTNQVLQLKGVLFHQMGLHSVALQYLSQVQKSKNNAFASYYVALCFHQLGNKYHDLATDNLNLAMALGAAVDDETMLKLGLDPAIHRRPDIVANP